MSLVPPADRDSFLSSTQDLKDYFGAVGNVRYADVLREAGPGSRSKGCGIVEFETPDEAAAAIVQLNDTELDGRKIFIRCGSAPGREREREADGGRRAREASGILLLQT